MRRTIRGHVYAEAFCLMTYKCEKCQKEEELWNSRDGVTPFMISCECKGEMAHINFNADKYLPNYQPFKGQRVFVNLSEETKNAIIERQFKRYQEQVNRVVGEEEKQEFIAAMRSDFHEGTPDVIIWGDK